MGAWKRFEHWFFGATTADAMALYRVFVGLLATLGLLFLLPFFSDWFTESGYVTLETSERYMPPMVRMTLLPGITDPVVTGAVFGLTLLAAIFTTIGLFSRVSSAVLALGIVSLQLRNPLILNSGDTYIRMMAIYLVFAPSGGAFSVDHWLARRKNPTYEAPACSIWPQRMMQLQVSIMYVTTVWHKLLGHTWRDGTATWYPSQLHMFDRFPVPDFINHPPFLAFTTYGTLIVELAIGILAYFKPLRRWVLIGGILLHGFIEYAYNIPLFSWIVMSSYVVFYEGPEVRAWFERRARSKSGVTLSDRA